MRTLTRIFGCDISPSSSCTDMKFPFLEDVDLTAHEIGFRIATKYTVENYCSVVFDEAEVKHLNRGLAGLTLQPLLQILGVAEFSSVYDKFENSVMLGTDGFQFLQGVAVGYIDGVTVLLNLLTKININLVLRNNLKEKSPDFDEDIYIDWLVSTESKEDLEEISKEIADNNSLLAKKLEEIFFQEMRQRGLESIVEQVCSNDNGQHFRLNNPYLNLK